MCCRNLHCVTLRHAEAPTSTCAAPSVGGASTVHTENLRVQSRGAQPVHCDGAFETRVAPRASLVGRRPGVRPGRPATAPAAGSAVRARVIRDHMRFWSAVRGMGAAVWSAVVKSRHPPPITRFTAERETRRHNKTSLCNTRKNTHCHDKAVS